jgi:HSP20 family molecular chaperone IbpA
MPQRGALSGSVALASSPFTNVSLLVFHPFSTSPPAISQAEPARRFIIRTDVHYDAESKVITAMLELPGLKKTDMNIKLSTILYNRIKQVTISGKSRPVFPEDGYTVRERKFGEFNRTLAVPPDTTVRHSCLFFTFDFDVVELGRRRSSRDARRNSHCENLVRDARRI